jgi:hypothetical protein
VIFAIDPGPKQSGWCLYDGTSVADSGVHANADLLRWVQHGQHAELLAIEMIASMGMAVGQSTFETVRWIGRFQQAWRDPEAVRFVKRHEVKQYLCGNQQAKDKNVRMALLDRFAATGGGKTPQIGIKAKPGPLFGVSSHAWSALAVAVCAARGEVPA